MPAPSHSLELAAVAARASCDMARRILVVLTLGSAGGSITQALARQPRVDEEPVMPPRLLPANDPRQLALGDALFHDTRLYHGDNRMLPEGCSAV
jgi:hypothetical protein